MSVVRKWEIDSPPWGPSTDSQVSRPLAGESGLPSILTPPVLRLFLYVMPIAADE